MLTTTSSPVRAHPVVSLQYRCHSISAWQRATVQHAPSQIRILRCHSRTLRVQARLPRWDEMYPVLTAKQLRSVSPDEAKMLQEQGAALVDVRRQDVFAKGHVEGAINIPMFQQLDWEKPSAGKVLKLIACAANGVTPVEVNPDFAAKLQDLGASTVVLMCEAGGTMEPSTNFKLGKESQSLKAAFVAMDAGVPGVVHLDGGVFAWFNAGLPMVGEYDGSNAARTPQIAAKPSGFYIDGEGAKSNGA